MTPARGSGPHGLLELEHDRRDDADVVAARGEIDVDTAPQLSQALTALLRRGSGRVVVDLSAVSFMDSSGLHVLLNALRRFTRQGRPLSIVCIEGQPVHRLLSLADLVGTFSVHRSRESALAGGDDVIESERR